MEDLYQADAVDTDEDAGRVWITDVGRRFTEAEAEDLPESPRDAEVWWRYPLRRRRRSQTGSSRSSTASAPESGAAVSLAPLGVTDSARRHLAITVLEHATHDNIVDVGKEGDSTGDIYTYHNDLYDETDTTKVGADNGDMHP